MFPLRQGFVGQGLVKRRDAPFFLVIPAKAGISSSQLKPLDTAFRRYDEFFVLNKVKYVI